MQAVQEEQQSLPCSFPAPLGKSDDEKEKNDKEFMQKGPCTPQLGKLKRGDFNFP